MIDWISLVDAALDESVKGMPKDGLFPLLGGNKHKEVGTKCTSQTIENKDGCKSVPTVPTVPTTFEKDQAHAGFVVWAAPGGGGERPRAPSKEQAVLSCRTCCHLLRPGLSDGYCGGRRADLLFAYGRNHPLRQLPPDNGAGCEVWLAVGGP